MFSIQFILSIFKDTKAQKIIFFFLAVSILQIIDLVLTIFMTHLFGEYLILAVLCFFSLLGFVFSLSRIKSTTNRIKDECLNSNFPENRFFELIGIYLSAFLIFIPGFISTMTGFVFLIPVFSKISGRYLSIKTATDWHTVYEYMKI